MVTQVKLQLPDPTDSHTTVRASVILIITDGRLNDVQQSVNKVSCYHCAHNMAG